MSNKVYDVLKLLAQIIMPFATMVVAILGALGYGQYTEVILAIAAAVNTFIGILLKASSSTFWKDKYIVKEDGTELDDDDDDEDELEIPDEDEGVE